MLVATGSQFMLSAVKQMNLSVLKEELEHLTRLLSIRADKEEDEDELTLAAKLLAILAMYYQYRDIAAFKSAFLATLARSYSQLYPQEDWSDLIQEEVDRQAEYLDGFADDLEADLISEREAKARAKLYSLSLGKLHWSIDLRKLGDIDLKWVWNDTVSDHCDDCRELNGTIRPASTWLATIYPRSGDTQCKMH